MGPAALGHYHVRTYVRTVHNLIYAYSMYSHVQAYVLYVITRGSTYAYAWRSEDAA
jgi:hypothetical protein